MSFNSKRHKSQPDMRVTNLPNRCCTSQPLAEHTYLFHKQVNMIKSQSKFRINEIYEIHIKYIIVILLTYYIKVYIDNSYIISISRHFQRTDIISEQ